ncbi:hypothetical protein HPB48_020336 [Haemaphysalis longicornis]|uniref:Caspase n=1 Tax=Haemaphysalis longicornis TaxID=44386 RepID=A0A9J6GPL4_HAELO|nr:hypothetical protein HPB48_020336 [Haemaphysalis longicornis]
MNATDASCSGFPGEAPKLTTTFLRFSRIRECSRRSDSSRVNPLSIKNQQHQDLPESGRPAVAANLLLPTLFRATIYPMEQNPRGRCIIINNYEFHGDPEAYRAGSQLDVCRMAELFKAFLFEYTVHLNLTAEEMKTLLSEKAREEQQKAADCLVVVLMSHGDKDTIYGSDNEELPLGDIYEMFNNDNCPVLQGKPKLFFVQTCRGRKSDIGTAKYVAPDTADAARIPCSSASEPSARVASWLDMYICYASVPGYEAHRNTATGAWFLSAVYRVFSQYAHTMHLQKLMHRVNDEVTSQSTTDGCFQTPCNEDRGLRKELWFNPGLFKGPTA